MQMHNLSLMAKRMEHELGDHFPPRPTSNKPAHYQKNGDKAEDDNDNDVSSHSIKSASITILFLVALRSRRGSTEAHRLYHWIHIRCFPVTAHEYNFLIQCAYIIGFASTLKEIRSSQPAVDLCMDVDGQFEARGA